MTSLIVIDPIDPSLLPDPTTGQSTLDQANLSYPRPNGVGIVMGVFQRLYNLTYPPGLSLHGYRISNADFEYEYDVPHTAIDNDPRVHEKIISLLEAIFP